MVISAVRVLRSLELYRNDLTRKGLTAVLDKCPHLEPLDVWNCFNITVNNNSLLQGSFKSPAIAAATARYSFLRQDTAICVHVQFSRYILL